MKNNNIANINTTFREMLNYWLLFTKPFHNLALKEQNVLSAILYQYFKLKVKIKDEDIIWKMVFDYDIKLLIKKDLNNMADYNLQNYITKLRKKKVIVDNKISKSYIPNIEYNSDRFKLVYNFNIKNAE